MSATPPEPRTYRELARQSLQQAADRLNAIPKGPISTDELQSHSCFAQAVATIAVAQALIEIGDTLRAVAERTDE